jgi:hypothetical protein
MSDNTSTTPHDGSQIPASRPNAAQRLWLRLSVWQRVLAVALVIGAFFGVALLASNIGPTESEAEQQCQARVELRLKSPSTADFGASSTRELGSTGARWEVTGVVDAENSFGGTVRLSYKCDMSYDEASDSWDAALVDVRE